MQAGQDGVTLAVHRQEEQALLLWVFSWASGTPRGMLAASRALLLLLLSLEVTGDH